MAATSALASSGSSRGGLGEVVAVGLGVDLDLVALQFRVEDVGPAAEVDDVEQVDVLPELLLGDVQSLHDVGDGEAGLALGGLDQHPGERHQAREALRPDRRVGATIRAGGARRRRNGPHHDGGLEVVAVALRELLEPLGHLLGELGRIEHGRVLTPVQHPGDHLAARGVLGLEDPALAGRAVAAAGVAEVAVGAEVALDQPCDPVLEEDLRRPLDLAELPLGLASVVAALEVLRRREVVLGLGGVGDLAADPREAEDPDRIALVGAADQ